MRRFLKYVLIKAQKVPKAKWQILALLVGAVFLKSLACVFWDIGATALFISEHRLFAMGMDFIIVAGLLGLVGMFLYRLDRNKGRGAVAWVGICTLCAGIGLVAEEYGTKHSLTDILFVLKYIFYPILSVAVWAVAKRFIQIKFSSLKFLSLFCWELTSFGAAGLMVVLLPISAMGLMITALFALIGLMLLLKTIFDLAPLPRDVFVRQTKGIQDVFERPLVWDILTLVFLGTVARVLSEAVLYTKLASTGIAVTTVLGLVWVLFCLIGLVMVVALYHTRYIYTTLSGMTLLGISLILTGALAFGSHSGPVASGYLMVLLLSHFYLDGYLQILPRLLSGGSGIRLKKRVMVTTIPLAFILCGSVCLNLTGKESAGFLMGIGGLFILITWRATILYHQVLLGMIEMRLWRKGPLMFPFPKAIKRLNRLLVSQKTDDVIYALRLMAEANHPSYETVLLKSLKHPDKNIRVFVLTQMRKLYRMKDYQKNYQKIFENDPEESVRQEALTNLILSTDHPAKYEKYLFDSRLRAGAVCGFLQREGVSVQPSVNALKQMACSKNKRDNLAALRIMRLCPDRIYGEWVVTLLKHPDTTVVQQALMAAGILKEAQALPYVLRALDNVVLQESALRALVDYGKAAFPPIEKMITREETPALRRKQLILFLGALPSGEGKQILLRALTIQNQKLRKAIVQNILDSHIIWKRSGKKDILRICLQKDIERISYLLHLREIFSSAPTHESEETLGFFLRAIQEDIDDTRELILYQLLLMENNSMFQEAVRILLTDEYELYLPALGVIQDLMSSRMYQKLKSTLILPLSQKRKNILSGMNIDETAQALSDVVIHPPVILNHWIRATALYALRRLGTPIGIATAEATLSDSHPIVLEAAIWTLVRLQPDKELLHQKLLTIPTSRLSQLSLDYLLES